MGASVPSTGFSECSARLLSQRLVSWQPSWPITFIAARDDCRLSVTSEAGRPSRFSRTLKELKRSPAIPPFRDNTLYHFAFVIHSAPSRMGLPVDPDTHLIKMPAPQRIASMMNTACPDLRGTQWANAVPPVPHGLMAEVDAALTQEIFDLSQR